METIKTSRGFDMIEFLDRYGNKCSITKSSLATEDCIWVGINNPNPLILAKDAPKYGIGTDENTGWVKYPIPEEVLIHTQMHLSIENARLMIPILEKFVNTGNIK